MAQTNFTPISLYYSSTASAVPTAGNLVAGELALNNLDGKLFYKDSAGVVQVIGTKGGVGSSTTTQVLYNSSGLVVGSANMTFSGTALTLANDASISGLTVGKGGGSQANNTTLGLNALYTNSTGDRNTAVGQGSLQSNTTASFNTAVGYQAGFSTTTGTANSFFGSQTGYTNTTGLGNAAFGANYSGVVLPTLYFNTTGSSNSAFGVGALANNTTASNNTAVGYQAGYSNTTGASNTFIGYTAGTAVTTGSNLTVIGNTAAASAITATNEVTLGNSSVTVWRFPGSTVVASLPSAATVGKGSRSFVTDALAPAFGSTVVGGGAVFIPVYSDGTNWKVG